jgi:hypothetical protein
MRVNVDSSVVSDPRFKLLGRALGLSWTDALGRCVLVWMVCYERRSVHLTRAEVDVSADHDGFAAALIAVGLAHADGDAIAIHGVEERIEFLVRQQEKGKSGGTRSGRKRNEKAELTREAYASQPAEAERKTRLKPTPKPREANGSRPAQAYSPALDLDLAPDLAPAQAPDPAPSPDPNPDTRARARSPALPAGAVVATARGLFDGYYRETHGGALPTWDNPKLQRLRSLLAQHGTQEFSRRLEVLRRTPPNFPPAPWDPDTFLRHFDKISAPSTIRGSPSHSSSAKTPFELQMERVAMLEAEERAAMGGEL